MWKRFGSPTKKADSGTEEEFEIAYKQYVDDPNSIRILFYFNQTPIPPENIDPEQWSLIQEFKSKLTEKGVLYWKYDGVDEFQTYIRMHLTEQIQEWGKSWEIPLSNKERDEESKELEAKGTVESIETTNLIEDEYGFLDLVETAEEEFIIVVESLGRMTKAIETLGEDLKIRSEEIDTLSNNPPVNVKVAKRMVKLTALDMDQFVKRMDTEIPVFSDAYSKGIDSMARAATITPEFNQGEKQLLEALTSLRATKPPIVNALGSVKNFRDEMAGLPRMSRDIIMAKNRTLSTIDRFIEEMITAENLTLEAEKALERAIDDFQSNKTN